VLAAVVARGNGGQRGDLVRHQVVLVDGHDRVPIAMIASQSARQRSEQITLKCRKVLILLPKDNNIRRRS
jgi:hypothetical protein